MLLTLFWQKPPGSKDAAESVDLKLRDATGQVIQSWTLPPVRSDYPPEAWPSGQDQRGQHALRLSGGLLTGDYAFELEGRPLGSLFVTAPERAFEEPAYELPAGVDFAGQAELVGYTLEPDPADPQALILTLVWRGRSEMIESYRVFVHLVDENGQIGAQSDAEPAAWSRPTTGWAVGEYVVDQHLLRLPDAVQLADWALRIGLYDARSGTRLPVGDQDAFLVLPGGLNSP